MLLHRFNFSSCVCSKTNARITLEKLAKQCAAGLCLVSGGCFAAGGVLLLSTLMLPCSTAGRSHTIVLLPHVEVNVGPLNERASNEKCLLLCGKFRPLRGGTSLGGLLTSRLC